MGFDIDTLRNENLALRREVKELRLSLRQTESPKPCAVCPQLKTDIERHKNAESKARAELEAERRRNKEIEMKLKDAIESKARAELECKAAIQKMQSAQSKSRELSYQPGPSMELNRIKKENRDLKFKLWEIENADSD